MENYTYNSYPESGGSSPRSREIDFENPTPWEDQPAGNNYKVKLMCSYGGKIHPRPHDNQLAYIGGETKILSVDRSIKFSVLVSKLAALCDADVCFKYQLPGEDLDALISVTNDDDLDHMMNEYDRLNRASPKPARLRLFLFPVVVQSPSITPTQSFGSTEGRSERERFVEALNSGPVQSSTPATALPGNADFLFGSEKVVIPPASIAVPKVIRDLPVSDPVIRPEIESEDRIQKHIQDLRRLRLSEDQQLQQQQHNIYRQSDENLNLNQNQNQNLAAGYSGEYYVQRPAEKVVSTTLQGSVPSPAPGYQISGGYTQSNISTDQQPVYMVPAPSNMYHAPMARPVTGPVGPTGPAQGQVQGQGQGYYAVQRIPTTEVYREPPVYNAMQPVHSMAAQPVFPPQQPPQKVATEGVRMVQSTAGMGDPGFTQVAYDSGLGRHVYYTAQGALVTPHQQPPPPQQPQQSQQPQQLHQVHLQQTTHHQYQPVTVPAATLNPDGKVIAPTKISQGSI